MKNYLVTPNYYKAAKIYDTLVSCRTWEHLDHTWAWVLKLKEHIDFIGTEIENLHYLYNKKFDELPPREWLRDI